MALERIILLIAVPRLHFVCLGLIGFSLSEAVGISIRYGMRAYYFVELLPPDCISFVWGYWDSAFSGQLGDWVFCRSCLYRRGKSHFLTLWVKFYDMELH